MLKIENGNPVIYKESKTMGTLVFKEIPKELAREMCIKYHYAHKWTSNFGVVNIGVFRLEDLNNCLGVASFGWMLVPNSYSSISDNIKRDEIIELNRLWVDDCLGKNTETMLLSACWKILKYYNKYKVVQSFADGRLGCGTIYKAASFKYYGHHITEFFEDVDTKEVYFQSLFVKTTSPKTMLKLITRFCDNKLKVFFPKTYRYIYTLDKKVNILLKEEPYPEYDKGMNYEDNDKLFYEKNSRWRGQKPAIFRGYILSKIININMNSSQIIANKILEKFKNDEINKYLNEQKYNETLNKLYGDNEIYDDLLNVNDWIPMLKKDSKEKQKVAVQTQLW